MKRMLATLSCLGLLACGHSPETYTPTRAATEPSAPVARTEPPAATTSPAPCPCATPPVSAPECSCPLPEPPKASTSEDWDIRDPTDVPEDIRGWYCYEVRRTPGDKDVLSRCRRTRYACERSRSTILDLKAHITACEYRDKASCFYIEDTVEKDLYMSCYTDYIQCLGAWADTKDKKQPHLRVHRCQEDIE